jgi:hypothetical protein
MQPSVEQMLEAAQLALREKVAPVVTDQWAASALRSVDVILSHLQARAPVEGPMLFEDNRDLAEVLSGAAKNLPLAGAKITDGTSMDMALAGFVTAAAALAQNYPSVLALSELNIRGRTLLDELLLFCHARKNDPQTEAVHESLRGYLHRHLDRERPFFFPTFVGRPV